MVSFTGLEHNFEKYTRGEVKTLESMKDFYDFDVSETQNNINRTFLHRLERKSCKGSQVLYTNYCPTKRKIVPLRKLSNPPPPPQKKKKKLVIIMVFSQALPIDTAWPNRLGCPSYNPKVLSVSLLPLPLLMDLISVDPIKLCKQATGRLLGSWNFNDVVFFCNV